MQPYHLDETRYTPYIHFDPDSRILTMKGQSYPEDTALFYAPVIDWIKLFVSEVNSKITLNLFLIYINTSSTKCMMNILNFLENSYKNGKDIVINWYYGRENDASSELAQDFKEGLSLPFNIIEEK